MHYGLSVLCFIGWCEVSAWHLLYVLPWPSLTEWFRWLLFFITGKLVWYGMTAKAPRKYRGRQADSQTAAGLGSIFDHH